MPKPGASSQLSNVYCVTASDCWAVGSYAPKNQGSRNQILHWTGNAWHSVSVPNPGSHAGSLQSTLSGIRCTGPKNCWAVGSYTGTKDNLNEALHYNGTRWTKVSAPEPGGTKPGDVNQLSDVTCVSSSACWAAGEDGPQGSARNEVLRWNGRSWSKAHVPQPAGMASGDLNFLSAIRCSSATRCLAVGTDGPGPMQLRNEALRWNGTTWSTMKTPQPGGTSDGNINALSGLTCASATNCWASGTDGLEGPPTSVFVNEILHWNGSHWLLANVPDPDGTSNGSSNQLYGDYCANASDCWAVGEVGTGSNSGLTEALHWNGSIWTAVTTPNPGGTISNAYNELAAIRCSRPSDCWAVGTANAPSGPAKNIALQWNGATWAVR